MLKFIYTLVAGVAKVMKPPPPMVDVKCRRIATLVIGRSAPNQAAFFSGPEAVALLSEAATEHVQHLPLVQDIFQQWRNR